MSGDRSRLARLGVVAALGLVGAAPSFAAPIAITSPNGKEPVFGEIEIAVQVGTRDPVSELALYVDGSLVARLAHPPFRLRYDVGQLNLEHQIVAEATTLFGAKLRATRTTPAMEVGEEVEVEMVQLDVRVAAQAAAQAQTLGPNDFKVSDETGARQPVTTVVGGNVPISTVVLVDSSDSMKGEAFQQAVAGAETTAGLLGKEDEVMVALFSDRLLRASEFTHDRAALSSALDADDVRWRPRRSQATLYWVRVESPGGEPRRFATFWKDSEACRKQRETLETAVEESGGGIVSIRTVSELSQALVRIYDDLRAQFMVGFYPGNRRHDGSWRPISVRASEPGFSLSSRAGYVDN